MMLGVCFKQCSSMQKVYRVRVVPATYSEHSKSVADLG